MSKIDDRTKNFASADFNITLLDTEASPFIQPSDSNSILNLSFIAVESKTYNVTLKYNCVGSIGSTTVRLTSKLNGVQQTQASMTGTTKTLVTVSFSFNAIQGTTYVITVIADRNGTGGVMSVYYDDAQIRVT